MGSKSAQKVPLYRNRRFMFYATLALIGIIVFPGGLIWWYQNDFPLPSALAQKAGTQMGAFGGPSHLNWLGKCHWRLIEWKYRRVAKEFVEDLPGTVWDEFTGGIIEFRDDKTIHWVNLPYHLPKAEYAAIEVIDKIRFEWVEKFDGVSIEGDSESLYYVVDLLITFPGGKAGWGQMKTNGEILYLEIYDIRPNIDPRINTAASLNFSFHRPRRNRTPSHDPILMRQ